MIEGIREIGEKILSKEPDKFLESLSQDVNPEKQGRKQYLQGRKQYLVIIEFDTEKETISFDFEEIKEDTSRKYLWLGNASASNDTQDRFTTDNLEYLVSQTLPNFVRVNSKGEVAAQFKILRERKIYYDLSPQRRQEERYRYVWNIEKLGVTSKTMSQIIEGEKGKAKGIVKSVAKEILEYLKKEKNLNKKDIALFTLKIDGKLLVGSLEYREYLIGTLINELFSEKNVGICYLCQEKKNITENMTKLKFKYYITDKIGFSSGLQKKKFINNFSLCESCYKSLLVGESFVRNNLSSYLAGTNLYIIPKFIFDFSLSTKKLKEWTEYIKMSFNSVANFEGLERFQSKLEEYSEFEEERNSFILNFLFYKKMQSEFRVLKLIKDIPPSRLDVLRGIAGEVFKIAENLFGENKRWFLTLGEMYCLFPVRISRRNVVDYKKILDFYDSLFSARSISYRFLIEQFIELAQVYRFKKTKTYNVTERIEKAEDLSEKEWDKRLIYAILEANLLLLYLRRLDLLQRGGGIVDVEKLNLKTEMKKYIEEMGYSEQKSVLFLLGYLIGEVGNAQYTSQNPTKPILNKITYQGVTKEKLKQLTNEIFEKLKQYKLLVFNECIFAEYKRLLDANIDNWQLSPQENVFYILSGYAYNVMKKSKENKDQKEDRNEEVNDG